MVPEWSFPGRGRVQGQLQRAKTTARAGRAACCSNLPLRGKQAEFGATHRGAPRARPSGRSATSSSTAPTPSARRSTASTACWRCGTALDARRPGARSASIPAVIDWDHYVRDIHLPSVVEHARVRTTPGGRVGPRPRDPAAGPGAVARPPAGGLRPREHADRVERGRVATRGWPPAACPRDDRLRFVARTLAEAPSLLALDRKDRSDFLRLFYRRYDDAPGRPDRRGRRRDVQPADPDQVASRPPSAACASTGALGHRTVLITGALDFVVEPLRPLFDDIVCASLGRRPDGTYDGELTDGAAHRRDPGPGADRLRRAPTTSTSREAVAYADSTSDLPDARGGRLPGGREPRDPAGRPGPQAGLAGRALVEVGRRAPARWCPIGARHRARRADRRRRSADEGARSSSATLPRFAAAMAGRLASCPAPAAAVGPLRLARRRPARRCPARAGCASSPGWPASAAATCPPSTAPSSPLLRADRVVPVRARPRGRRRPRRARRQRPGRARAGARLRHPRHLAAVRRLRARRPRQLRAHRLRRPRARPADRASAATPAAAGRTQMVAHPSQLHAVPDDMTDEAAVMVEPTACAVHGALARRACADGDTVVVHRRGHARPAHASPRCAGSPPAGTIVAAAKHPAQRELAARARRRPSVVEPGELRRAVRRITGTMALGDGDIVRLTGGADVVVDCVGSDARSWPTRWPSSGPAVAIAMVGMPGRRPASTSPALWQREITLAGAYAYGTEHWRRRVGRRRTFDLAFELVAAADLGRLVSRHLSPGPLRRRHRPRRRRRPPRRGQDRLRPPRREGTQPMSTVKTAPSRVRPRRRPVDAADPVPPRRELPAREAARPAAAASSTRPSRSSRSTTSTAPSATPCCTPLATASRCPALLRPGMKLTIAFDDISLPLPPMRRPDIRQRVIEAVLDLAAAAGVDDVAPHRRAGAAPAHDRGRAAPRRRRPGVRRVRPAAACSTTTTPRIPTTWPSSARPTRARRSRSTSGPPRATCSSTSTSTSSRWTAAGSRTATGLASYRSLRHHHNVQTMQHRRSFMDRHHSRAALVELADGQGARATPASRSSRSRRRINNDMFGTDGPMSRPAEARVGVERPRPRHVPRHEGRPRPHVSQRQRRKIFQSLEGAAPDDLGAGRRGRGRPRGDHRERATPAPRAGRGPDRHPHDGPARTSARTT